MHRSYRNGNVGEIPLLLSVLLLESKMSVWYPNKVQGEEGDLYSVTETEAERRKVISKADRDGSRGHMHYQRRGTS